MTSNTPGEVAKFRTPEVQSVRWQFHHDDYLCLRFSSKAYSVLSLTLFRLSTKHFTKMTSHCTKCYFKRFNHLNHQCNLPLKPSLKSGLKWANKRKQKSCPLIGMGQATLYYLHGWNLIVLKLHTNLMRIDILL